jgi:transketolase
MRMKKNLTMRDAFFNRLYELARKNRNIIVVSADMGAPGLDKFRKDLRSQFLNVGIAEANMVTVATGLALSGKKVFIYAIMPFVTSRCYEMIKIDLSLMNIPVTAVGVGAGFGYDDSGPTHHSTEDIAIMRALPNMTILCPSDSIMAARCADMSCAIAGPSYVRLDRHVQPIIYKRNDDFSEGISCLKRGEDICIISTGNMVHRAREVSDTLATSSIDAGVLDVYRIKPLNERLLLSYVKDSKRVVTIEEHLLNGGLGSLVAETLMDCGVTKPLKRFGVKDKYYYAYGGRGNIQKLCGLDADTVTREILEWYS